MLMNDANFSDAEKQIGIFLSLMLTGTKTLLEIKRGKKQGQEMHAACVQVVDLSAPYELLMANTIQIFRS